MSDQLNKYKGQLSYHMEMGCGCWPQFHDDRGLHGDNNQYWNWDWTINFQKKCKLDNIKIFDHDGEVVYDGPWTWNRQKTGHAPAYFSCCDEIDTETWIEYCRKGYRAEIETDLVVRALDPEVNPDDPYSGNYNV